jgi:hypothetical protein
MTNEQLKILLVNIAERLYLAIAEADAQLDGVQRHKSERYIGKNPLKSAFYHKDPDEWEEYEEGVVALDPIRTVVDDLKDQANMLVGELKEDD